MMAFANFTIKPLPACCDEGTGGGSSQQTRQAGEESDQDMQRGDPRKHGKSWTKVESDWFEFLGEQLKPCCNG